MPKPPGGAPVVKEVKNVSDVKQVPKEPQPVQQAPMPSQENAPPTPKKVAAFGQFKLKSKLSLTKKKEEEQAEEVIEDLSNKPRTPFTFDQLKAKWKSFSYKVKKENKLSLLATLTKHELSLNENFEITLLLDNDIQVIEVETAKVELLGFLRKELNNYGIQLITKIVETQEKSTHLTSKDKFLKMAEKNEALNKFREQLGLEIEY